MTVLVCGEALFDVFCGGDTRHGIRVDARLGGAAFNTAVALARLGRPAALLAGVSTDALGERIVRALAAEGIDTAFLKRCEAPTTLAVVDLSGAEGPRYAFHGERGADRQVRTADAPPADRFEALVFGSFSMLTRPTGNTFLRLARSARVALVVVDLNVRLAAVADRALWRRRIEAFVAHAHVVKASEEDVAALYDAPPAVVARRWLECGVRLVACTRGVAGATLHHAQASVDGRPPAVRVVDTVGAGDAFLAALLAELAELGRLSRAGIAGLAAEEAERVLTIAQRAGALACARRGADPPRRRALARAIAPRPPA